MHLSWFMHHVITQENTSKPALHLVSHLNPHCNKVPCFYSANTYKEQDQVQHWLQRHCFLEWGMWLAVYKNQYAFKINMPTISLSACIDFVLIVHYFTSWDYCRKGWFKHLFWHFDEGNKHVFLSYRQSISNLVAHPEGMGCCSVHNLLLATLELRATFFILRILNTVLHSCTHGRICGNV